MNVNDLTGLNDCGCCEGLTGETPLGIDNRPGLSAIAYRVGTQSRFKASMLARLSDSDLGALKALMTREDDDFSIALLDAWASVADVLTFYQERIANENYLRTATERNSVLQLARLIGYKLRPGVAASVYLAFTLEDAQGAPKRATIPIGTKLQSVPGPGEQPQTFETIEQIDARAEWNAIKPRLTKPQPISTGMDSILLKGTATKLAKGDALLIIAPGASSSVDKKLRRVETIQEDHAKQQTTANLVSLPSGWKFAALTPASFIVGKFLQGQVSLSNTTVQEQVLNQSWNTSDLDVFARAKGFSIDQLYQVIGSSYKISALPPNTAIFAMRKRAALFGYNAPPWKAMADSVKAGYLAQGLYAEYFDNVDLTSRRVTRIDPQLNFNWGSGSPDPAIPPDAFSARWTGLVKPPAAGAFTFYTHSDDGVRLWVDDRPIIDNWTDHGETEDNGTIQLEGGRLYSIRLEYYERAGSAVIKLFWSGPSQPKEIIPSNRLYLTDPGEWPLPNFNTATTLYLDQVYKSVKPGDWVVLQRPNKADMIAQVKNVQETAAAYFAISGQVTAISFDAGDPGLDMTLETMDELRQTCVYIIPEELPTDDLPDTTNVQASPIQLDGPVQGLTPGQVIMVSGTRADADGVTDAESAVISEVMLDGGYTTLKLVNDLLYPYLRDTVSINGNVALATNGETKTEVLGGGDASQAYQQFTLKQPPLTYIGAATPSGAESTLKIYVNDVQWHEQSALYGAGARDRIFVTQLSDDGKTTVEFGDGQSGARLPTGRENIQAAYRQGIGTGGNVKAGQLSLLMAAPLGVKSVTNPQQASGGADSEKLDDARTNAPITVLTLDRVVSLTDYEDFARAFAGIAKALATWTWDGQTRGVFLTVAGPTGADIPDGSETITNLIAAMQDAGDPHVPLRVQTYVPAFFRLSALVNINPDYQQDKVMGALTNALRAAFSFDARGFGQGVALSQVVAVMQAFLGVYAVDVTKLYRVGDAPGLNTRLVAAMPQAGAEGQVQPAELLMLDPGPIDLGMMS